MQHGGANFVNVLKTTEAEATGQLGSWAHVATSLRVGVEEPDYRGGRRLIGVTCCSHFNPEAVPVPHHHLLATLSRIMQKNPFSQSFPTLFLFFFYFKTVV